MRYSKSSIVTSDPSIRASLIRGRILIKISATLIGLGLEILRVIILGPLSPLLTIRAEKSRSCVIIIAFSS